MSSGTEYAYAVGRIRAIERKLLDKNRIDRMVDSRTPDDVMKMLSEVGYGMISGDVSGAFDYEAVLKDELKKVYLLLNEITPDPEVFKTFLYRNDFHNIKVLLKSEFLNKDESHLLADSGSISLNSLKTTMRERSYKGMPEIMKAAIEECLDTFNRTADPQVIDIILDKACFKLMKETAAESGISFLVKLIDIMIDLINIKSFLRANSLKKSWDFVEKILLQGGIIDKRIYLENLGAASSELQQAFARTPYSRICEQGLQAYETGNTLTKFEKLCDDYLTEYVKKAKYIHLGIEPLIAYLTAKETEIRNVRIIMIGKINNISNDIIRERLRETYV